MLSLLIVNRHEQFSVFKLDYLCTPRTSRKILIVLGLGHFYFAKSIKISEFLVVYRIEWCSRSRLTQKLVVRAVPDLMSRQDYLSAL